MSTPTIPQRPHRRHGRVPTDLSGTRTNAVGEIIWGAETDSRGRTHLTISADTPLGDFVVATLTYSSYNEASTRLASTLDRFERTTLAHWNHPSGTRQTVRLLGGWFVSVGREPGRLPLVRCTRLTAGPRLLSGWTRFEIVSVRSSR